MPRGTAGTPPPKGILELDRFTEENIEKWNELSADLDELNDVLHFNLEPERRRLRPDLIAALRKVEPEPMALENWIRIVDYRWALSPLAATGSLTYIGGRFNAGQDLDRNTLEPWPTLYIAEDHPTAYREKFQLPLGQLVEGLSPEELSLGTGQSHVTVILKGTLKRVFMMTPDSLAPVARVLSQIKMPPKAEHLKRKLKIQHNDLRMVASGRQLYEMTAVQNWRILPVQFGLPSPSQILAELIRAADFEAIAFTSSKGSGLCLAVFVDKLSTGSFVELTDKAPPGVIDRLDGSTADTLAGWAALGLRAPNI